MLCTLQAAGLDELVSISTVADMSPGAGNSTHTAKSNLAQASGQLFPVHSAQASQAIKLMALSMQGAGDGQDLQKCKSQSQSQSQSQRAMARPDITGDPLAPKCFQDPYSPLTALSGMEANGSGLFMTPSSCSQPEKSYTYHEKGAEACAGLSWAVQTEGTSTCTLSWMPLISSSEATFSALRRSMYWGRGVGVVLDDLHHATAVSWLMCDHCAVPCIKQW